MRPLAAALLALVACSRAPQPAGPPPDTWTASEYTAAGLPDPGRAWTDSERAHAVEILQRESAAHREILPRYQGPKSGPIFARLIEPTTADDPAAPLATRFTRHTTLAAVFAAAASLYASPDPRAPVSREAIELGARAITEDAAAMALADQVAALPPAERPATYGTLPERAMTRLMGALELADQVRLSIEERRAIMQPLAAALPAIAPRLSGEQRQLLRETLTKQVEAITNANQRDFEAALRALP